MVIQVENYEVYALTWDDVFKSFELRHAPLLKRLNYDREKLAKELMKEIENEEGRDGIVFIILGIPLLEGQNTPYILLSVIGVMVETIAIMAVYSLGIVKKYEDK